MRELGSHTAGVGWEEGKEGSLKEVVNVFQVLTLPRAAHP